MPYFALPLPLPTSLLRHRDELMSHPCYTHPRKYLRAYGIRYQLPHRAISIALGVTALLSLLVLVAQTEIKVLGFTPKEVIVAIWALGALLLGYQQWRETRHEISLDKYYERLEIANRKRELGGLVVYRMMHPEEACTRDLLRKDMLVYSELDNLEYTIEKYKLGYMKPEQACRGLRTFQHRCRSEEFLRLVQPRAVQGDYGLDTRKVVQKVAEQVRGLGPESFRPPTSKDGLSVLDLIGAVFVLLSVAGRIRPRC